VGLGGYKLYLDFLNLAPLTSSLDSRWSLIMFGLFFAPVPARCKGFVDLGYMPGQTCLVYVKTSLEILGREM
jgi:hypothetical protein